MSDRSAYTPHLYDTDPAGLSEDLAMLTEDLAEFLHDVWAQKRMEEGWRWGRERNDKLLTSPCLVPYDELPDQEKSYDRSMAVATIKVLLEKGYRIEKKS